MTELLNALTALSRNSTPSSAGIAELSSRLNKAKTALTSKENELRLAGAFEEVCEEEKDTVMEEVPEEVRSPRSRPKTWPDHAKLTTQFVEELEKFDKWLKTTEENLETFIGISIPQTLNEMNLKLKEIQVCCLSVCLSVRL